MATKKVVKKKSVTKTAKKKPTPAQLKARKEFTANRKKVSSLVKSGKAKNAKAAWKQIKK